VAQPVQLKAPILVVTPFGERDLERGEISIGRSQDAHVILEDPLASRQHARILILEDETAIIEDLHSSNGVFLNGARMSRPTMRLNEGDRLLIGTTELSVFSGRQSATLPIGRRALEDVVAPKSNPAVMPSSTTERNEALAMIGHLANRLMATGRRTEAIKLLAEHLNKVLLGASAGLSVPESVLGLATRHALDLFTWTRRASWIDYVFELHLACQRMPGPEHLDALEVALRAAGNGADSQLFDYFLESLQGRRANMSVDEQARATRLLRLKNALKP
jgi:pSer/pThr/pTyr-binding forkhead associated (FHA) protein